MTDATITIDAETLHLLPERAIYWERTETLFIADTHFGKSVTAYSNGHSLPRGDTADDLKRLTAAIYRTGAKKLIVLGDLIHARVGRGPDLLNTVREWREDNADLKIILIRGNHDRHAVDPPADWRITCVNGPTPGPYFVLMHKPQILPKGYGLAGHLHPAARLDGHGKQPCFWVRPRLTVLPAFSGFTDGSVVRATIGDQVYAIAGESVVQAK